MKTSDFQLRIGKIWLCINLLLEYNIYSRGFTLKSESSSLLSYLEKDIGGYGPIFTQGNVQVTGFNSSNDRSLYMEKISFHFATFFSSLAGKELDLVKIRKLFHKDVFDTKGVPTLQLQVQYLASNFSLQLKSYEDSLDRVIESVQFSTVLNSSALLDECCNLPELSLNYDQNYKLGIRKDTTCWFNGRNSLNSKTKSFVPSSILSHAMIKNSVIIPAIRWQYFISPDGVYVEYPANRQHCQEPTISQHDLKTSLKSPERKAWLLPNLKSNIRVHRVVFLLQLGRNPSSSDLSAVRTILTTLLPYLDEGDQVGLLSSDPDKIWSDFVCQELVPVTQWIQMQVINYINFIENRYQATSSFSDENMDDDDTTIVVESLNRAMKMACVNFSSSLFPPPAPTIIHLTTGWKDSLHGQKSTIKLLSSCPLFIESYLLNSSNRKGEEDNLRNQIKALATKNVWGTNLQSQSTYDPSVFALRVANKLNSKKNWWSLTDIINQFFPVEERRAKSPTEFSHPFWNPVSKEAVVVAKKFVFTNGGVAQGLAAVEIPLRYFVKPITYYVDHSLSRPRKYAFLIDLLGRVIVHPSIDMDQILAPIQIHQVEVTRNFISSARHSILNTISGCITLEQDHSNHSITYAWSRVRSDFVIVLVDYDQSCSRDIESTFLKKSSLKAKTDVQLQYLLEGSACVHSQWQNINKGSIFLSPSAFTNSRIGSGFGTSKQALALMAFLGDTSGLLHNRGLLPSVKNHLGQFSSIVTAWKKSFTNSALNPFIYHRFGIGGSGTFLLTYPGIRISSSFHIAKWDWYQKGLKSPAGILVLNPPVMNSLSTPVSSLVVKIDDGIGLLGITFSYGIYQKLAAEGIPRCNNEYRCFFVDEDGYFLYHPKLKHSSTRTHLTELEPVMAANILQSDSQNLMSKDSCHKLSGISITEESIQRTYKLSLPMDGISTHNDQNCFTYDLIPLQGTNAFLGIINENCTSPHSAFCPCSTVDTLCLNCFRMDPTDCECPCECPKETTSCIADERDKVTAFQPMVKPCPFPTESFPLEGFYCENPTDIDQDNHFHGWPKSFVEPCYKQLEKENCTAFSNCKWCEEDSLCKSYQECNVFKKKKYGVNTNEIQQFQTFKDAEASLNSENLSSLLSETTEDEDREITIVPLISVVGVICFFLIFLAFIIRCYRNRALSLRNGSSSSQPDVHLLPLNEQVGNSSTGDDSLNRLPISTLEEESVQQPVNPYHPPSSLYPPCNLTFRQASPSLGGSSVVTESDQGYFSKADECSERSGGVLRLGRKLFADKKHPTHTKICSEISDSPELTYSQHVNKNVVIQP